MTSPAASRKPLPLDPGLPRHLPIELEIEGDVRITTANDLGEITPWVLFEQEDWFEGELGWLRQVVEPGWQILDIGANHGVYAASLARKAGSDGCVIACEPSPLLQERLHQTIRANRLDNLSVRQVAMSDHAGRAVLGGSESSETARLLEMGRGPSVAVETVDRLLAQMGMANLDFIKIDTEGHERLVVAGATATLAALAPLVMVEVDAEHPGHTVEVGEALRTHGYDLYHHLTDFGAAVPLGCCFTDNFTLNMLACKPERARQLEERGLLLTSATVEQARANLGPLPCQADLPWKQALAQLRRCFGADLPLAERVVLAEALAVSWLGGLRDFVDLIDRPSRLTSLVRLLRTVGARRAALEAMRPLLFRFEAGTLELDEPGLAIAPAHDGSPYHCQPDWTGVALIEQMVSLRSFAAFFADGAVAPLLNALRDHPAFPPRLERVRQLLGRRSGDQRFIEATPKLLCSRNARFAHRIAA